MDIASSSSTHTRIQEEDQRSEAFKASLKNQKWTVRENSEKFGLVGKPEMKIKTESSEIRGRHSDVQIISMIPIGKEKCFPIKTNKVVIVPTPTEFKHVRQIKEPNLTNLLRIGIINMLNHIKFHRSRKIQSIFQNEVFGNARVTRFLTNSFNTSESQDGLVKFLDETRKLNIPPTKNKGKEF